MCKILALAGINASNRELAWKLVQAAQIHMNQGAEKDGYGYAAATAEGALFGERWFDPAHAFVKRDEVTPEEREFLEPLQGAAHRWCGYNSFGSRDEAAAIMAHARFATCEKTLENVHPFVAQNTALIHNGVIINPKEEHLITSTCDSETILGEYLVEKISDAPDAIEHAVKPLRGTYAVAVLGTTEAGVAYMDVFKNSASSLIIGQVEGLGMVFCTTPTILEKACKDVGTTLLRHYWMRGGFLIRIAIETGEVLQVVQFQDAPADDGWERGQGKFPIQIGKVVHSSTHGSYPGDDDEGAFSDADIRSMYNRNGLYRAQE